MRNFRKIFVIFFVWMSDIFAIGNEPHCSKFHYEEKLLEKLVRMEFNMEQREKELKEGFTELNRKQTEAQESNQLLLQELEKELTTIRKENKELKEKLVDAVSHIEQQGNSSNKVLFKARQLKDTGAPNSVGTLIFKEVLTNVGGGYNNSTGVFTCPADGAFLFTIHLCVYTKYCNYAIMIDGIKHTKGSIKDDDWGDCITAESIAIVKTGSKVWVENYGDAGFYDNAISFNHFSGIMIYNGQF